MSRHNRRGRPRMDLWFETSLLPGGWATGVRIGVADGRIVLVERVASPGTARPAIGQIGRASGRASVCPTVEISVVAVSLKKKIITVIQEDLIYEYIYPKL